MESLNLDHGPSKMSQIMTMDHGCGPWSKSYRLDHDHGPNHAFFGPWSHEFTAVEFPSFRGFTQKFNPTGQLDSTGVLVHPP